MAGKLLDILLNMSCIKLVVIGDETRSILVVALRVQSVIEAGCVLKLEIEELVDVP